MLESRILEKRDRREGMNGTIFQIAVGRYASKLNPCLALKALLPVPMVHSFFCAYRLVLAAVCAPCTTIMSNVAAHLGK